jgi:hypothetical protein
MAEATSEREPTCDLPVVFRLPFERAEGTSPSCLASAAQGAPGAGIGGTMRGLTSGLGFERMCRRRVRRELACAKCRNAFVSAAVRGGLVAGARRVVVVVVFLWRGVRAGRRPVG